MPIKVTLNESEQKLVERVSRDRSKHDKKHGFADYRRAKKQSARFIETNGLGGEIAFCKLFNIFPDIVTNQVSDYDALLPDGTKVEIKTTQYAHGKLIARHTDSSADIYVLVTGTMPNYVIVGYVKASTVKAGKGELNGKTAYIVEQRDFVPIEELKPQNADAHRGTDRKAKKPRRNKSRNSGDASAKKRKKPTGKSGTRNRRRRRKRRDDR